MLTLYLNNYVIIPDYNEQYYFSKLYIININTSRVEEILLDNKISFNSVFLGDYKNIVYLLDKKEEKEYKINIKKKEVLETDFWILENNKGAERLYRKMGFVETGRVKSVDKGLDEIEFFIPLTRYN